MSGTTSPDAVPEPVTILDLPEEILVNILGRLSPSDLCRTGSVCTSMWKRCRSDHLWKRHMREKWGELIGEAAVQQWLSYVTAVKYSFGEGEKRRDLIGALSCLWPSSSSSSSKPLFSLALDSIMYWFVALESGKFEFPAQVYNREVSLFQILLFFLFFFFAILRTDDTDLGQLQKTDQNLTFLIRLDNWIGIKNLIVVSYLSVQNGNVGYMLSCYDADVKYDRRTNTFRARYPPHRMNVRATEDDIPWERLRTSPLGIKPKCLHITDCLDDLHPNDHFEVQWRGYNSTPSGWWYGVVGHLDPCGGEEPCLCHDNEIVVLEFRHYGEGSPWRRALVSRRNHVEEGNDATGFYGGIRKLHNEMEISKWMQFWPTQILS